MYRILSTLALVLGMMFSISYAQDTVVVTGTVAPGALTSRTFDQDTIYVLDGYVTVDNGDTLTIQAGTVVLAETGSGANASALIVERDGYIIADGTAAEPIIFTSKDDNPNDPNDLLDKETIGLWGGVIMCGDATTNTANNGNEQVEGIPATLPATVGTFGGTDDTDDSGILRYVSIRHSGAELATNDEIQGLTLAGVGSGTTIEFVESYASDDDGIELFGGTVNLKNVVIAFAEDDALDYDQGYRGKIQNLFVIQSANFGDRTGELDGADSPENGMPFATPTIYNATIIGNQPAGTNNRLLTFRANGGGKFYNSVFIEQGRGVDIEYKADANVDESSYDRFVAGDLDLANNIFWNVAGNTAGDLFRISPIAGGWTDSTNQVDAAIADIQSYFPANNELADPQIEGLSYADDAGLDPRFRDFKVYGGLQSVPNDGFFTQTTYKGAFGPAAADLWAKGWTALDHYGYLVQNPTDVNIPTDTVFVTGTTGDGTVNWTNDQIYVLSGYVRVDNGDTLVIEPGTVVLAETGSGANASALVVERDGYIIAEGTATNPIIFSSIDDDVNDPDDLLDKEAIGLWGGIIMCGDAETNTANNGSEQVEGIPATLPGTVGTYGGTEDDDDSGILRYVSIRHTGAELATNDEIQGLTLAGVGRGTTIEFVESYASDDDGIEIFGGTVNLRNILIAFAEDDMLDYDQGYRGNIQNLFIIQSAQFGDRGGELDGADSPEDGMPFGTPTIYNMTLIGNQPAGTNNRLLTFRANGGGRIYNSVFIEQGRGVDIEYKADANVAESSYDRFATGGLDLANNIFWNVAGNDPADLFRISPIAGGWTDSATMVQAAINDIQAYFPANNQVADPIINGLSYTDDAVLDPRFSDFRVYGGVEPVPAGGFFTQTGYKGAFGPDAADLWIKGWTALDHYGYLVQNPTDVNVPTDTVFVTGTTGDGTTVWSNTSVYVLDGYVRVDNGDTLIIEAGTVVLAETGSGSDASALIVERDGYIDARGTAADPIIFSSIDDDVNDPNDLLDKEAIGLWGGIIVCGDATTNTANNGSEQVEGIPATLPGTVGTYGGTEDDDNSGILRYLSIRHTGAELATNDEIQGLTLAGVGRGTTIEFIESYASDDDGIEIFGGTVNMKNIAIIFAEDDMLDYDQGYTGKIQNLFIIQSANYGDRTGELDGADSPEDGMPFGAPTIYNATIIGNQPAGTNNRLMTFRANGGGKFYNSVFIEQGRGVDIEYKADANVSESSYDRFVAGDLDLTNNVFWNVAGNDTADLFRISPVAGGWTDSTAQVDAAIADIQGYFPANNLVEDPQIAGLSYTDDGGLDPRFSGFAVNSDLAETPNDGFFSPTTYKGAFGSAAADLWITGWTAIDHYGYLVSSPSDVTSVEGNFAPVASFKLYPNPNRGMFTVEASNLSTGTVEIVAFDLNGRMVYRDMVSPVAGAIQQEINIAEQPAGMYFVTIKAGEQAETFKVVKQ